MGDGGMQWVGAWGVGGDRSVQKINGIWSSCCLSLKYKSTLSAHGSLYETDAYLQVRTCHYCKR